MWHAYAPTVSLDAIAHARRKPFTASRRSGGTAKPFADASTRKCAAQRETSRFQGGVVPSGHITKSFARTIDETRRMPASTAPFASAAAEVSRTGSVFRIPPAVTNGKTRATVCSRHP